MGQFYYAAKAFDILQRFDNEREYEDAIKGAVVGTSFIHYFNYINNIINYQFCKYFKRSVLIVDSEKRSKGTFS